MVSIMILAIAILPMVGMFDMGLNAATKGSNYDKARTLANLKMEEAKSLPFADVKDNFPVDRRAPPTLPRATTDSGLISDDEPDERATSRTSSTGSRSSTWQQPPTDSEMRLR